VEVVEVQDPERSNDDEQIDAHGDTYRKVAPPASSELRRDLTFLHERRLLVPQAVIVTPDSHRLLPSPARPSPPRLTHAN
jgi:hypothetical protein